MSARTTWCITGASGLLGGVLVRQLVEAGESVVALSGRRTVRIGPAETLPIDITKQDAISEVLRAKSPSILVHLAAVTRVGEAVTSPNRARRVNVEATRRLVELSADLGARCVYASTDLVFDGTSAPYDESAVPNPLSVYGRTKLEGEAPVLEYERGAVARLALMFGLPAVPQPSTFAAQLRALRDGTELTLFEDEFRTPLWLEDAARALRAVAASDFAGRVHVGGPERISRLAMGWAMAEALGLPTHGVRPVSAGSMAFSEPRPPDVSLDSRLLLHEFSDLTPFQTVLEATGGLSSEQIARLDEHA